MCRIYENYKIVIKMKFYPKKYPISSWQQQRKVTLVSGQGYNHTDTTS